MNPYDFQTDAIDELQRKFAALWQKECAEARELVLKAPTGSGKTFMTCKFIDSLQTPSQHLPPQMDDMAFFWITFSDELAQQSKGKFADYFYPNIRNELVNLADCGEKIRSNAVVFVNWQKLSQTRGKERLRLRRPKDENEQKEQGVYFEDVIEATHRDGRQIVMVIDESHTHVETANSQELIDFIAPRLILKVSATPFRSKAEEDRFKVKCYDGFADIVEVPRERVVEEGLVKETIECQTEEDLRRYEGSDIDEAMLDLAMERRRLVKEDWERAGERGINPLVLVQLPNDEKGEDAAMRESKEEFVRKYLKRRGVPEGRIATWLANEPLKAEWRISENDSEIDYLLFKYAAGTGWDCPRAHILVMFREIHTPVFQMQTLGRIVRMAVHGKDLRRFPQLRTGYLYTTYARNMVGAAVEPVTQNKLKVHASSVIPAVREAGARANVQIELSSLFSEMQDANEQSAGEAPRELSAKVESVWDSHREEMSAESGDEAQKAITEKVVTLFEDAQGRKLSSDERQRVAAIVKVNAEIHQGRRDGEVVLDPVLKSDYVPRAEYGDLGKASEFQRCFMKSMDEFFERGLFARDDESDEERLRARGIDVEPSLRQSVMVGTKFRFENKVQTEEGGNADVEVSRNDVANLFTMYCAETLKATSVGNIARSWSVLREAMRQWYRRLLVWSGDPGFDPFYRIAVKDFARGDNSVFKAAILKAISDYRPILDAFIREKKEEAISQSQPFAIKTTSAYTDDFAPYEPSAKSMRQPFYLRKQYNGRENEARYIQYLEGNAGVKSWIKNADSGLEALSIRYEFEGKTKLFNPDWIVVYVNGDIGIYDTKKGVTGLAQSPETRAKRDALAEKIAWLNEHSARRYVGGIVELIDGRWVVE